MVGSVVLEGAQECSDLRLHDEESEALRPHSEDQKAVEVRPREAPTDGAPSSRGRRYVSDEAINGQVISNLWGFGVLGSTPHPAAHKRRDNA